MPIVHAGNFPISTNIQDTFVTRNTCIEIFTGTWCAPCHYANLNFRDNLLPNFNNYSIISYHMGPDVFATWEGHNRAGYYNNSYVPDFYFDGQQVSPSQIIFDSCQQAPAFMTIDITDAHYTDSTVYVNGQIHPLIDYPNGAYTLQVIVIEKYNSTHPTTMDTAYFEIGIKMSPSEAGTPINSLEAGVPIPFNHVIPIEMNKVQSMGNLKVVVFVQNNNDKIIQQSAWKDITFSNSTSETANNELDVLLYPNPTDDKLYINLKFNSIVSAIKIFDVLGNIVYEAASMNYLNNQINISNFNSGIYLLEFNNNKIKYFRKFIRK